MVCKMILGFLRAHWYYLNERKFFFAFAENEIGDEGAGHLAKALEKKPVLRNLCLGSTLERV
jgi:hypothetical protein